MERAKHLVGRGVPAEPLGLGMDQEWKMTQRDAPCESGSGIAVIGEKR